MKNITILMLSFLLFFCKDRYEIKVKNNQQSIIVIEGNLDNSDSTEVRLSTTTDIKTPSRNTLISNAIVLVEGNSGSYPLVETTTGKYKGLLSNLLYGKLYRLHIKTDTGMEYISDSIEFIKNPPIDSISWGRT